VKLVAATLKLLEALQRDPAAFAELIGSPIPDGWPEFPESIEFSIVKLGEAPDESDWWLHFFLADKRMVGSGGFVGPPTDGTIEIGYEIAPAFRGRGYATAASRALIDKALSTGSVDTVVAHTLAAENPSTSVLRRLGFRFVAELPDDEQGSVWRWSLSAAEMNATPSP
jgi:RimJ/RimL family protein N-acetyltransferase